jgi:hypothetical protein
MPPVSHSHPFYNFCRSEKSTNSASNNQGKCARDSFSGPLFRITKVARPESTKPNEKGIKKPSASVYLKNDAQIAILMEILRDPFIKYTKALRNDCCTRTGLEWHQVYKWNFDRITYLRKLNEDKHKPLFKVERIRRRTNYFAAPK